MDSTKVVVKCVGKRTEHLHSKNNPVTTIIELQVPYEKENIYHKLSGGTNLELRTINQDAADMFELEKNYDVIISPSAE